MKRNKAQFMGCLLGGAIGDAFGAPVKFMKYDQIIKAYGKNGIVESMLIGYTGQVIVTDDTQLTLFTAEGLIRSIVRADQKQITRTTKDTTMIVFRAYLRWLYTQGLSTPNWGSKSYDGWLVKVKKLYGYRDPGITCITALGKGIAGTLEKPINTSERCGPVIRVAPVGLIENEEDVFDVGCRIGAITHGHPTAYLASGALATLIFYLVEGCTIEAGLEKVVERLKGHTGSEECILAIEQAIERAKEGNPSPEKVESFGDGFFAKDALAMGIYCSLCYPNDFTKAITLAINQSGNSNSAAAITGNILGAYLGDAHINEHLIKAIDLEKEVREMAEDLYVQFEEGEDWSKKYPGW